MVTQVVKEARDIQIEMANRVVVEKILSPKIVAGVDVSVKDGLARAAVVVMSAGDMSIIEISAHTMKVSFPYIPGLLAFREIPVILAAFDKLKTLPDALIVDGQGIAHPRRFGLASHLGVELDLPAIGCAKTRLVGVYEEPEDCKGAYTYLRDKDEIIGAVLRTRKGVKPVFISTGHKVDLEGSIKVISSLTLKFRLPEPIRSAHKAAAL
jgi:deoxyribonuclease V